MVKVLLSTVLLASWLLQSCTTDDGGLAGNGDAADCTRHASRVSAPAGAPAKVRVGVTGTMAEAAQYLADAEGYFGREGLQVELINFTSTMRMIPALAAGQLDVGSASIGPGLFNASENNLCVKVVGALTRQEVNANGVFLVVRKDLAETGRLQTYGDLRGRQIGVAGRDSSSEYALSKLLAAGGLSLQDVRMLQMSYPTIQVSLANKSIDAAIMPEGVASVAEDKGLGVRWKPVSDVLPGAQFGVLLFAPQFAAQKDVAIRWMTAYLSAARDYDGAFFHNVRRGEIVDQLVKSSPIKDPHLFDEMGFAVIDPNGGLNLDSLKDQMQWSISQGELREPVDLAQLVDESYAQAAAERLGPYQSA